MSVVLESVVSEPCEINSGDRVYDADAVRSAAQRLIDLPDDGLLAVIERGVIVSFAVFSFHHGPTKDLQGNVVNGVKLALVFFGDGVGAGLREMRHTYWGEDGYLFHAPALIIIAALTALKEWFDV